MLVKVWVNGRPPGPPERKKGDDVVTHNMPLAACNQSQPKVLLKLTSSPLAEAVRGGNLSGQVSCSVCVWLCCACLAPESTDLLGNKHARSQQVGARWKSGPSAQTPASRLRTAFLRWVRSLVDDSTCSLWVGCPKSKRES